MITFAPGIITNFLLILLRAGIVLNMLPFLGSRNFPPQFRIGLAVAVALVLSPVLQFTVAAADIPVVVFREVVFGMILGLAARFIFYAVDMAGQVMSNAVGLSMATIFNPEIGQSTEVARLYGIIVTLLFLAVDAHHDLIVVFIKSYEWVPAGAVNVPAVAEAAISLTGAVFVIALKLAAPVLIIMLVTNVLLGFVAKAAPQMNVFFVGYPVYLFVGFVTMLLSLPVFIYVMQGYFKSIPGEMGRIMQMMKG